MRDVKAVGNTPSVLFPDVCAVVVPWLRDLLEPVPVHATIPDARPAKFVHIVRTGGVQRDTVSDAALLVVDCWAQTDAETQILAALVRKHLQGLRGEVGGTVVQRTAEAGGPAPVPDPETGTPRAWLTYEVVTRGDGS